MTPDQSEDVVLDPDDLIDDKEIADRDLDLLAHRRIADQLDAIAASVPHSSNIALYGQWGSGKSGIGQLLGQKVRARKGFKFARFDAFKFAETPLRRNFISAVATELGVESREFHDELYSGKTSTELTLPASKWLKIVGVFTAIVLSLTALLVGAVALISLFVPGSYADAFKDLSKAVVAAGVVPAALLAGLITMANKSIQVDRSVAKPESDEQFEALFKKLVKRSGARKLVVFVDELDRCAADEVVATLDAIRTFLGVEKCIFVIAADQRVLEEALTKAARQETPGDGVNPYYSTGNAYLDKVFQYQVSVPPLLSQSITSFAADLVKDRGGLWREFSSDYIVSILVPTHVTSPRRVKHLLNAFALAYRLAEDRHQQGLLAESPQDSAAALARLVCLKVEFPLFARDLTVESRLPQMVLDLVGDPKHKWSFAVSDEARDIAERYAGGSAPAQILAEDDSDDGIVNSTDATPTNTAALTIKKSNRQLITYLWRTKSVRGPSRDLVFMQSSGTDFGIDGESALEIENAARNGETEAVTSRLSNADEGFRLGTLRLLVHQMRTAVGVEGENSARTFLGVIGSDDSLPVESVADSAAEAIALLAEDSTGFLDEEVTPHAWKISSAGTADASRALRRAILQKLAGDDEGDVEFVLRAPRSAIEVDTELLGKIVAREIVSEGASEVTALLGELEAADVVDTLTAASGPLAERLALAIQEQGEFDGSQVEEVEAPASASDQQTESDGPLDPAIAIRALQSLARTSGQGKVSDLVILTLLNADSRQCRDGVEEVLGDASVALVVDSDTINAALGPTGVQRRAAPLMLRWLNGVDAAAIGPANASAIESVSKSVWERLTTEANVTDGQMASLISALATLIEQLPKSQQPSLTEIAVEFFEHGWAQDDDTAAPQVRAIRSVELCAKTGLMAPQPAYREAVARLADSFASSPFLPFERGSALVDFLLGAAVDAVRGANLSDKKGIALLKSVIEEIESTSLVNEPLVTETILRYSEASGATATDLGVDIDATKVIDLINQHEQEALTTATLWFRIALPNTDDSRLVLDAAMERTQLTEAFVEGIDSARKHWDPRDAEKFLSDYIVDSGLVHPSSVDLRAMGFKSIPQVELATILVSRFAAASNNVERQVVVDLWKQAKIADTAALRRLVEGVTMPLFRLNSDGKNAQAAGIGFATLNLLSAVPSGTKAPLGAAVKAAVGNDADLEKRAAKLLEPLGYQVKKSGIFRRRSKPKYDER